MTMGDFPPLFYFNLPNMDLVPTETGDQNQAKGGEGGWLFLFYPHVETWEFLCFS